MMTVADVANYLKLSDKTVLRLVKHGEIPCAKIANQWRFFTPVLEEWIAGQMVLPGADDAASGENDSLLNRLGPESFTDLEGESLWAILRELAGTASSGGMLEEADLFLEDLARSEGISSTLLGSGILLLHLSAARGRHVKHSGIVAGYSRRGIAISSLTERRARLVFLILSPEPARERLEVMNLMDCLSDELRVRDLLSRCDREELYKKFF